ncbi:hypothetical protein MHYP_G00034840 [Metynnis hypsauchen]
MRNAKYMVPKQEDCLANVQLKKSHSVYYGMLRTEDCYSENYLKILYKQVDYPDKEFSRLLRFKLMWSRGSPFETICVHQKRFELYEDDHVCGQHAVPYDHLFVCKEGVVAKR